MDPSLKPDPLRKGSYYRRLEDVARAMQRLESDGLSETMRFFVYYFGCEKIAHGLVGIHARRPATEAYGPSQKIKLDAVKAAVLALGLTVSQQDLAWLFASFKEQNLLPSTNPGLAHSARILRNDLTHDFGPSNVARIAKHAPLLNPKMKAFLESVPAILEYQRIHFAGVA